MVENENVREDKMEPLAYRMKPTKLEDFYGQEDIVGKDKLVTVIPDGISVIFK